jgi:hypothetical protein
MTDDPEATLEEWKESMQAEHEAAIANPDPDAEHRIEAVSQVNYRVTSPTTPRRSRWNGRVGSRSRSCPIRNCCRVPAASAG